MTTDELILPIFIGGTLVVCLLVFGLIIFLILHNKKQTRNKLEKQQLEFDFKNQLIENRRRVQEQSLRKISRELHENIAQYLLLAQLKIRMESARYPERKENFDEIIDNLNIAIHDMRSLSHSLNDQHVKKIGLIKAIEDDIAYTRKYFEIAGNLWVIGEEFPMDPDDEVSLVRVIQESIRNIYRHAQASEFNIEIDWQENHIMVTIWDNGKGFDTADPEHETGIGLLNMKERIEIMGGTYEMSSTPGSGTTINIVLPKQANELREY